MSSVNRSPVVRLHVPLPLIAMATHRRRFSAPRARSTANQIMLSKEAKDDPSKSLSLA